jgi:hypothetical protein
MTVLDPWPSALPAAWWLVPNAGSYAHKIGGSHSLAAATCPNCVEPLLQLGQLDTTDPKLSCLAALGPVVPLLFCWRCGVAQSPFVYRVQAGRMWILQAGREPTETDFPYPDYPRFFEPQPSDLVELNPNEQAAILFVNEGGSDEDLDPEHQVGGEPYLLQGRESVECQRCDQTMAFLAAIADHNSDPRGFTSNPWVQVLYFLCRPCHVLGVVQRCG